MYCEVQYYNIVSYIGEGVFVWSVFTLMLKGVGRESHWYYHPDFYPEGFHSHLVASFSLAATGNMSGADINTGYNEIFKIEEKISPIKASLCCDPEDARGLT